MSLSWLRQWVRRFFPVSRRPIRRVRFVRPRLMPLEDRVLLSVSLNLEVPQSSSYGVTNSAVIQYTNTGTTDAPAPVLVLSADNANLWLPNDPAVSGPSLQVLATNPDPNGPAGTLAPGASGSIVVDYSSTTSTDGTPINFSLGQLTTGQTIDWSSIESDMRPSYINATAWNAVFANFTANVGSTTDSYQTALDDDATYLAQLGEPTNDVASLVAYEISKADNDFGTAPLGGAVDVSVPTPGPDLSIARSFQPTISGRNQAGLFGLGWTSNWDVSASTDTQGNVTINEGGGLRYFAIQSDGSYQPTLGDTGTLTALTGGYQLTEIDGSLTAFNANGTLNYMQDSNGNRITAGFNSSGQMVSLTESDGDALTLAYNSQGFISKITDPSGETASYTYDSAGHLRSVTTPQGTTKYTYITGTGTGADNALQTILNPDGTQINYTYDSEGRLSGSFYGTAANPIEPVTVGYLTPGGVTYTDANGNKTTVLSTDLGQPAVITDPLGHTTKLSYDPSGDLTNAVLPGGTTYSYTYDLKGNLISETDGLGNTTHFIYDTKGNLLSYTDAKGNTTKYAYDSSNDLLSVTYANGAKQSYTYNPLGEATQFLNARGQAVGYTYNKQGQLTKETFADGSSYSYTYDAHGNLTSAKDAQGRVTKFIYGGDPNNPNNPDLLTEVEYPDGTYLKFSYYAGGLRKQSVDQTGFTVNYTYDPAGNLSELTDGNGNVIVKYTYDAAGNLIQQDNGNGTRTVYTYDAAGKVLSITNLAPDHTTVNSFDNYTYDALGNVLTDTNQDGQWVYTYDADSQLVQAMFTPNSTNPDRLTAQNIQYAYDAAGNRRSETVNGVTTTYAVNNVNEYTSSTTAGATTTYQYDKDGNLIAQTNGGSTTNYTFNELNQLTGISGAGLTASYFYDPLGNRVSQTVNGVTTNFQIDPAGLGNVVAAFSGTGAYDNSGGLLTHYTYGLGLVSQVSMSGATGYYDFGLTGNTIGITNAAGSYVNKYSYLPFGQTTATAAALPNPFTFVGQFGVMQDAPSLFDMGAREYSMARGHFLSSDPLGLSGGDANVHRYAMNNPTNLIDPSGLTTYYVSSAFWKQQKLVMMNALQKHINPQTDPYTKLDPTLGGYLLAREWDNNFFHDGKHNNDIFIFQDGPFAGQQLTGHEVNYYFQGMIARAYNLPEPLLRGIVNLWRWHYNPLAWKFASEKELMAADAGLKEFDNDYEYWLLNKATATTDNSVPGPIEVPSVLFEGIPSKELVLSGGALGAATSISWSTFTSINAYNPNDPTISVPGSAIQFTDESGGNLYASGTFPEEGGYQGTVTLYFSDGSSLQEPVTIGVQDAPLIVQPVDFSMIAGQPYNGPVATITDLGPANDGQFVVESGSPPATFSQVSAHTYKVFLLKGYLDNFGNGWPSEPGQYEITDLGLWDNNEYGGGPGHDAAGTYPFPIPFTVTAPDKPQYESNAFGQMLNVTGKQNADPPLAIIDTTDPSISSASQVSVSVGTPSDSNTPIPLVTGTTLTQLPGGLTQIVVNGVVSAVQPGAGLVAAAPLNITVGNEPSLTAQVMVDETSSDYIVNPASPIVAVAGQPVQNVQVATLSGPANSPYSATIDWGDGDTSNGVITALGGGQFLVTGSKPHPYAATGMDTFTVTVNGPGAIPAPQAQTTVTVVSAGPPIISKNPTSQTVTTGQTATFTASASGAQSVQWQVRTAGGSNWSDISGATTTTLTLNNITKDMNDDEYQAVFRNSAGTATTSTAILTVDYAPTVTINPSNKTVTAGQTAKFTAAANGNPTPTVQWQVRTNGGPNWTDISNATSTTLTLYNVATAMSGNDYRAVFTNGVGFANTTAATLTVTTGTAPVIVTPPSATVTAGQAFSYTVGASGIPTPHFTESGALPSGVAFTDNGNGTASLWGTPAADTNGTYSFTITAYDGVSPNNSQGFTLTVNRPPPATPNPPPLLAWLNGLLGVVEAVNGNDTTLTASFFGFPLVETYDYNSGNLLSVTILGINITGLFK